MIISRSNIKKNELGYLSELLRTLSRLRGYTEGNCIINFIEKQDAKPQVVKENRRKIKNHLVNMAEKT